MVDVTAVCPIHGPFPTPNLFGGTGSFFLSNVKTICPICGRSASIQDGRYEFIGNVLTAFREAGVTKDEARDFLSIVKDLNDGRISSQNAEDKTSNIKSSLSKILKSTKYDAETLNLLIAALALIITIYSTFLNESPDVEAHRVAHRDAQDIQQVQQGIYQELKGIRRDLSAGPEISRQRRRRAEQLTKKRQPRR